MNSIFKKSRFQSKLSVILALSVLIFFEWLEYSFTPMAWPKFSLPSPSKASVKILIVGDPQLLGYRYSPSGILGSIYRWDADRYTRKTFKLAFNFVKPDLILFLGDNFDEGEVATDEEFIDYFQRFRYVFQETDFSKALIVPGDNDIGGESAPANPEMEKRFNKYFRDDVFIQHQFLEFYKINYITHSGLYRFAPNISTSSFKIILSHVPLTPTYSSFVNQVIPYIKPHIILSAHDHKSQHIVADRRTGIIIQPPSLADFNSHVFNMSDVILHEILAPTCSYRMGTHKMGYGALEISDNGEAFYAVLWLPSRFRQLLFLALASGYLLLLLILYNFKFWIRRKNVSFVQQYQAVRSYNDSAV